MKKEIYSQKQKENSITFKKYKVNVYEDGFPFVEPLMTNNFVEAINFAKKTIESQRGYRSTSKDLFAEIDKFQRIEERGNVRYPYSSFASFSEEDLKSSKFDEGGVMSKLLTRKKDQPKVETTDEDIDLNEDTRIRVRPSSFVRKDKEGDWMMKNNSSKEARSYAGGGSIERRYNTMSKEEKEELMREKIGVGRTPFSEYRKYNQLSNYHKNLVDKYFSGKLNYAGGGKITIRDIDWANADNKKLGVWLLTSVDGNKILQNSKNAKELEKNVMDYYKKRGSVAKMTWDEDADEGLSWVTFGDLFLEIKSLGSEKKLAGGGKVTFSEKAKAIAKNFEGKRVEPKYQKEYGKVYDKDEAKEVGNKIAGSQKASYDAKLEKGSEVKKGKGNHKMKEVTELAKKIRKDGEKWTDALRRAYQQMK